MTTQFIKLIQQLQKRNFDPTETMQWLTSDRNTYWSWGVSKKINFNNVALALKVSAHHWKGYVVITLDWNDTYIVSLVTTTGRIHKTIEGVYCDELAYHIDQQIEYIPEYN